MRKKLAYSLASLLPLIAAACTQEPAITEPESPFRPVASIQEIMKAIVAPSADYLWNAVGVTSTETGVEERQPRTDDEWLMVRYHALELIEATNLLAMDGRRVTAPDAELQDAGLAGNLTAEEIQLAIDANGSEFVAYAHALHDAAMEALAAVEARDPAALSDSGGTIDTACEQCHTTFWYPNPS